MKVRILEVFFVFRSQSGGVVGSTSKWVGEGVGKNNAAGDLNTGLDVQKYLPSTGLKSLFLHHSVHA